MTSPRARIVSVFETVGKDGAVRKLTAPNLVAETGLGETTISSNMRVLAETGWFELDWEDDVDPYDFSQAVVRRRIFPRATVRDALSQCLRDFNDRLARGVVAESGKVEYAAPRVVGDDGLEFGRLRYVAPTLPGRAAVLLYCLEKPTEYHHTTDIAVAIGEDPNNVRSRMLTCEEAGLVVSRLDALPGNRRRRRYRLSDAGLVVARDAAAARLGGGEASVSSAAAGDGAARKAEAARLAGELAGELRAVQDRVKLTGTEIAGIVERQASWWSKATTGLARQPDVEVLERLLTALMVEDADVTRILGVARKLRACRVRCQPSREGQHGL